MWSSPVLKFKKKKYFFAKPADKLTTSQKCPCRNETHRLYQCKGFNDLTVPDRRELVSKKRLCLLYSPLLIYYCLLFHWSHPKLYYNYI